MRNVGACVLWSGTQGGFDLKGDGVVGWLGDGEAFGVDVADRVAGREFVQLSAGLQGEGANGLPGDVRLQGLQGLFEIAAEGGVQAVQGRQRLCYAAPGRGAVGDGEARSKAAGIA